MKYYLIAGEASGDLHAAHLMRELKLQDPSAEFRYYGGDAMAAEGGQLVCHYRNLAYMGFYQVITHLGTILSGMRRCKQDILAFQPDALILVDYPGFNLGIAKWMRRLQVDAMMSHGRKNLSAVHHTRIYYYISPKIWAWKSYRINAIRRDVDQVLSILPFEVDWYAARGCQVTYVGNPTVDELYALRQSPVEAEGKPYILLVPGSRRAEVSDNLHVMLQATEGLGYRRVIAGAPGLSAEFYREVLQHIPHAADAEVRFGQTHQLMRGAQAAAVTSGTATLEAAYLRCPQVVCYNFKGGYFFYNIMKWVLRHIRYVSLVNLLIYGISSDETLPDERHAAVTELLGPYLSPQSLRAELQKILPSDAPERQLMLSHYDRLSDILGGPGAPQRAASAIVNAK